MKKPAAKSLVSLFSALVYPKRFPLPPAPTMVAVRWQSRPEFAKWYVLEC